MDLASIQERNTVEFGAYTEAHRVFHNMEDELDYPVPSVFLDEFKETEEKTMAPAKDAFTFVRKLAKDLKKEKARYIIDLSPRVRLFL